MPESLRNGVVLGYRIFYKPLDVPLRKYHRAPRSVNPLAAFGALPGEKMLVIKALIYETKISGLNKHSWYTLRIGALTSKGLGVLFAINGTSKQESKYFLSSIAGSFFS